MAICINFRARAREAICVALTVWLATCTAPVPRADAEMASDSPAAESDAGVPRLLAPTLGRPVFIEPGGTFDVVARIPHARGAVSWQLIHPGPPPQRYPLSREPDTVGRVSAGQPVRLSVPPTVPPRTYDLEIRCNSTRLVGRHCVAVGKVDRTLRLVHLSNMNIGDVGAPHFDERLIDEINLLAPTLIVATGDYLDATHPDPRAGWQELVDCFTRFEAPVLMACGDHDDIDLYSRHAAPSPIGVIEVGAHRGIVLYDHPRGPISDNPEQLRWVEQILSRPGFDGLTFIVSHDDAPNLLQYWQRQGVLTRMTRAGRVGLWLAGGHRDWNGQAFAELIEAANPMVYVRTHQSSPAAREGSTGVSHYRVIDVIDDRVSFPQPHTVPPGIPSSIPVGRLSATIDGANDGTLSQLGFSAVNNLPNRLNGLSLWLHLKKLGGNPPWCHGARLEEVIDSGTCWDCRVRFDLPDKGALQGVAGSEPEPQPPQVSVRFDTDDTLYFARRTTPEGITFLQLIGRSPLVHLANDGDQATNISPLVRLDGDTTAYRPLVDEARFATAYRLRIQPGERLALQLDFSAVRVSPGRRELQVYLHGLDHVVPYCRAVEIVVDE